MKRGRRAPRSSERAAQPSRASGNRVTLRPGREKSVLKRHPWVFSGAIASIGDEVVDGDAADIVTAQGDVIARGYVNRRSQIIVRILTWDSGERLDSAFWIQSVDHAASLRPSDEPATRLVYAESDRAPGLIIDRYGDWAVLQAFTLGADRHKGAIATALRASSGLRGVYERSDVDGRDKEGLAASTGVLAGDEPPDLIRVAHLNAAGRDVGLLIDVRNGHKTGAYLDQRQNRRRAAARCAGADVLDLFGYTGAFAVEAAVAGAKSIVTVDSSAEALSLSHRIAEHNGVSERIEQVRGDAFSAVRKFRDQRQQFDVIWCDPPKLVHGAADLDRGARAYKDINRIALQLVRPGGLLATFSCSGLVSGDLFQKIAFSAALEAKRDAQIIERFTQADDHPVLLSFPEGEYLKGLLLRVL